MIPIQLAINMQCPKSKENFLETLSAIAPVGTSVKAMVNRTNPTNDKACPEEYPLDIVKKKYRVDVVRPFPPVNKINLYRRMFWLRARILST